jgi:hypothetical protein
MTERDEGGREGERGTRKHQGKPAQKNTPEQCSCYLIERIAFDPYSTESRKQQESIGEANHRSPYILMATKLKQSTKHGSYMLTYIVIF